MKNFFESAKRIYNQIYDDESRYIFENRLLYSSTDNTEYIRRIVRGSRWWTQISSILQNVHEKTFIFGAGGWGRDFLNWIEVCEGFIDNNESLQGKYINGKYVYSLDEIVDKYLRSNGKLQILIVNYLHHKVIKRQCIQAGIPEAAIVDVGYLIEDMIQSQYFDLEELPHIDREVFVDVGCLDGQTVYGFLRWCGNRFQHIYCLEPDEKCFSVCKSNLYDLSTGGKLTLIPKGAYSFQGEMSFQPADRGMSSLSNNGDITIAVERLDNIFKDIPVSFIKMDIEGAEMDALKGAESIIRFYRPKLAISIYHRIEDIIEIPSLLLSFYPEYEFYLRHYSLSSGETVLYAI